jgi:hypothetical protein
MKTRTNTTSAAQANRSALYVRTQLRAGRQCHPWDTKCVSRQNPAWYNSCVEWRLGAGSECFIENVGHDVPFDEAVCEFCG